MEGGVEVDVNGEVGEREIGLTIARAISTPRVIPFAVLVRVASDVDGGPLVLPVQVRVEGATWRKGRRGPAWSS